MSHSRQTPGMEEIKLRIQGDHSSLNPPCRTPEERAAPRKPQRSPPSLKEMTEGCKTFLLKQRLTNYSHGPNLVLRLFGE